MENKQDVLEMLRIVTGDIVKTEVDAIVNPTDGAFSGMGGVDSAIHSAAGARLARVLQGHKEITEGQAIITPSFEIRSCEWIIHTVGPRWKTGFCAEELKLAQCYRNCLTLAMEKSCESIAFPCISVGANRFPEERAAEIALHTVYHMLNARGGSSVKRVLFVCNSEATANIYRKYLKSMLVDAFIHQYSPESFCSFPSTENYFLYMRLLGELEWGNVGHYQDHIEKFLLLPDGPAPCNQSKYDMYARNMDHWDYSTCLSYIIYLQRSAYWSGGEEAPHYDQWANGTVRRVLIRMRTLLHCCR